MPGLKTINPPDQVEVLKEVVRHIMVNLNCVQVGRVEGVDLAKQTVDVQVITKQVKSELPNGTRIYQEWPLLMTVPFLVLSGGAAHITFPIAKGDECLVLFNDRDIDNWHANGGAKSQPPNTYRCHDLSDGFALIGVRSLQNLVQSYLTNGIEILLNATNFIRVTPDHITITSPNIALNGTVTVTDGGGSFVVNTHTHKNGGGIGSSGTPNGETP